MHDLLCYAECISITSHSKRLVPHFFLNEHGDRLAVSVKGIVFFRCLNPELPSSTQPLFGWSPEQAWLQGHEETRVSPKRGTAGSKRAEVRITDISRMRASAIFVQISEGLGIGVWGTLTKSAGWL
jgi:hypothetical protein